MRRIAGERTGCQRDSAVASTAIEPARFRQFVARCVIKPRRFGHHHEGQANTAGPPVVMRLLLISHSGSLPMLATSEQAPRHSLGTQRSIELGAAQRCGMPVRTFAVLYLDLTFAILHCLHGATYCVQRSVLAGAVPKIGGSSGLSFIRSWRSGASACAASCCSRPVARLGRSVRTTWWGCGYLRHGRWRQCDDHAAGVQLQLHDDRS